jgi:hexosaminidase
MRLVGQFFSEEIAIKFKKIWVCKMRLCFNATGVLRGLLLLGALVCSAFGFFQPEPAWTKYIRQEIADDWEPATLWPMPSSAKSDKSGAIVSLCPSTFDIECEAGASACTDLFESVKNRYKKLIFYQQESVADDWYGTDSACTTKQTASSKYNLQKIMVRIDSGSTDLQLETDDSYTFVLPNGANGVLSAPTIFGVMKGLETFTQLVHSTEFLNTCDSYAGTWDEDYVPDPDCNALVYHIPNTPWDIDDTPRYKWRGLLLDLSRNFFPVDVIKKTIRGLSYAKMNTLHLHSKYFPF